MSGVGISDQQRNSTGSGPPAAIFFSMPSSSITSTITKLELVAEGLACGCGDLGDDFKSHRCPAILQAVSFWPRKNHNPLLTPSSTAGAADSNRGGGGA